MDQKSNNIETKYPRRDLSTVLEFMNADFGGHPTGKWVTHLLKRGMSAEKAQGIKEKMLSAHRSGSVLPLEADVRTYAKAVRWVPEDDHRRFSLNYYYTSHPESELYVLLLPVINEGLFWSIKQCAECPRFFLPRRKQRYCSNRCQKKTNSKKAQKRVEANRRNHRYNEIRPRLFRVRELAKTTPQLKILDKLRGFDPQLLAIILDSKKRLTEIAPLVKYRNRQILMKAKI